MVRRGAIRARFPPAPGPAPGRAPKQSHSALPRSKRPEKEASPDRPGHRAGNNPTLGLPRPDPRLCSNNVQKAGHIALRRLRHRASWRRPAATEPIGGLSPLWPPRSATAFGEAAEAARQPLAGARAAAPGGSLLYRLDEDGV